MADQFIQVPPQSTGLKIDCTELTVGANTVERERQNIADPSNAAGLAGVVNSAPGGGTYGLVTWNQPSGTQTVSGTITATQATGSNLHVVVDTAPTTTVTGTVGATQGTSPWVCDLTQVANTALGATAVVNYGSTPAAVAVPAVNSFVTNTVPVTGTFFQGTQPVSGTVTANQGTANTLGNAWPHELTDGTNGPVAVKAASTAAIATDKALVVAVSPNNTVAVTGTFFQGTQPISGTVTANQGAPNSAANSWSVEVTDGTNILGVSAHPLRVDPTGTTTQPVSGTVTVGNASLAVTQSTSPWVVGQSTAANLNATVVGTVSAKLQDGAGNLITSDTRGSERPLSVQILDASGNQITSFGGSGGNAAAGATGSPVPLDADYVGYNSGGNLVGVSTSNALPVAQQGSVTVTGTVTANQGSAAALTAGWPVVGGQLAEVTAAWTTSTSINTALALTVTGYSSVNVTFNQGSTITGGVVTFEASDTIAGTNWYAVQGVETNNFISGSTYTLVASTNQAWDFDVSGWVQFRVRLSTTISGTATVNVGIAANAMATVPEVAIGGTVTANAGTGTFTVGQATGTNLHVVVDSAPTTAVTLTSTTVTGTVAVTQSTSPWVANITQVASTALGVPQSFGTAPTGVVLGTSSDLYVAGTRARSNQTTTAAGVQDVNVVGSLGVTNSVTNGSFMAITDNTTKAGVIAATTALKTDLSSVAGTATVTAASGVQKVGITGNTNATLDAAINTGAAPTNALWTATAPVTVAAGALSASLKSAQATAVNIKASAGNLYGFAIVSATATAGFIEFFNTATTATTGAVLAVPIAASGTVILQPGHFALLNFTTGIAINVATPLNGTTTQITWTGTVFFL